MRPAISAASSTFIRPLEGALPRKRVLKQKPRQITRARWRYLLRHPEFRADINRRVRLSEADDPESRVQKILTERKLYKDWGLEYIPTAIRMPNAPGVKRLPELTTETAAQSVLAPIGGDARIRQTFILRCTTEPSEVKALVR